MTDRVIRIGSGSGFVTDSAQAVPQLLERGGKLDYIMLEYLAEGVMAWLAADEAREPGSGFSPSLVNVHLGPHLATVLAREIRVVTNSGGLNPHASASALHQKAATLGLHPRIAVVTGDDLRGMRTDCNGKGMAQQLLSFPVPVPPEIAALARQRIAELRFDVPQCR